LSGNSDETQRLLERAQDGNQAALVGLFQLHRAKLHRAIALRMDRRMAARVDASDVLLAPGGKGRFRTPWICQRGFEPIACQSQRLFPLGCRNRDPHRGGSGLYSAIPVAAGKGSHIN